MNKPPPCAGRYSLFDSRDLNDHHEAKAICRTCPVILECAGLLRDAQEASTGGVMGGPQGTWAGRLVGGIERPRKRALCGTDGGYYRHTRHGESACDACLGARAEAERVRAARKREREAS